jgi:hypothetical protein
MFPDPARSGGLIHDELPYSLDGWTCAKPFHQEREVRHYQITAPLRAQPLAPSSPKAGQSLKLVSNRHTG